MKKIIVTTTINEPTEALIKFSKLHDWQLVVVGDQKTPGHLYKELNCIYLSPEWQENQYKDLSDLTGWNCVQRRNIGFLYAAHEGADLVATVDDDNIPYEGWGSEIIVGKEVQRKSFQALEFFDPLAVTNHPELWHRGYPIQYLDQRLTLKESSISTKVIVQADFWDGDPDIDAICRIARKPECKFDHKFYFSSEQQSPFNSQNTFLSVDVLKDYFCFPFIHRMDDIWASYYLQTKINPVAVAYGPATVYQERNPHDLSKDLMGEVIGYEKTAQWVNEGCKLDEEYLPKRSIDAFNAYRDCF